MLLQPQQPTTVEAATTHPLESARLRALGTWLASRGPAVTGFLALLGAAVAFAILYVDYPFPASAHSFTESGPYFLWLVFLCGQTALWFALLPTLARALRAFAEFWPRSRRQVTG